MSVISEVDGRIATGRVLRRLDDLFAWYGAAAACLLAVVLITQAFARGWSQSWFVVVVYLVIAYFVLPRIHTALAAVYLPDYFIGRTRTREGILGDPVNIALLGSGSQIHRAMISAGWVMADDLGIRANFRIVVATLTGRSYSSAPVSNLFLFGRRQAFCYQQEVNGSPGKRHHVRFWPTPGGWLLPGGGQAEWLAAGTFDRSVRVSVFTWQITHRISDDVDAERDYVVDSLASAAPEASVDVIENFSTGYHSRNGGGDAIVTDGSLPVVDLRQTPNLEDAPADDRPVDAQVRPADIIVGSILIAIRPLAAAALIVALVTGRSVSGVSLGGNFVESVVAVMLVAVFATVWWVLAYGVAQGKRGARFFALVLSGVAVATLAVSWLHGADRLTMENGLAGFAIDVAILFALSGPDARRWSSGLKRHRRFLRTSPVAPRGDPDAVS